MALLMQICVGRCGTVLFVRKGATVKNSSSSQQFRKKENDSKEPKVIGVNMER